VWHVTRSGIRLERMVRYPASVAISTRWLWAYTPPAAASRTRNAATVPTFRLIRILASQDPKPA